MSRLLYSILTIVLSCVFATGASAQSLSAEQILSNSDDVSNEAPDLKAMVEMVLIEADGDQSVREMEIYQKGADSRMMRFLSPAGQRGIGFLSLPDDVNYLYLPAFGRVRRIASHVENQNFAGTDFSYDDLSSFRFGDEYDPSLNESTETHYILELTPKSGISSEYSKLIMWVRLDNFYPAKIEYYNRSGDLWKVLEQDDIQQIQGYWVSMGREMSDVISGHSTIMNMTEVEVDTGLSDDIFSQRYLTRIQ
jgi:outer membrane lipoprotein-sorting protein